MAGALALLALLASALAPSAQAATFEYGSGQLDWGVKKSFREYIEGPIAHGVVEVSAGAVRNGEVIEFPVFGGSYDDVAGAGEIAAVGSVRFSGHHGTLDMTLSNPVFAFDKDSAMISAHVGSKQTSGEIICDVIELAEFDLTATPDPVGSAFNLNTPEGLLTTAGEPVFGNFYEANNPMHPIDPVSITAFTGMPAPAPAPPPCPAEDPTDPTDPTDPGTPADPGASDSGAGGGPSTAPLPPVIEPKPNSKAKPKRCRKGFRKVKVKGKPGKTRCVKKKRQPGKKTKRAALRKAAQHKTA